MTLTTVFSITILSLGLLVGAAVGQPILGSEDSAIAIDEDAVFLGPQLNGRYPAAENPPNALDGNPLTKYLNFGGAGSGFIVTPFAPLAVESFQITTANDAETRDPATWALYGHNGALVTTDSGPTPAINADGLAEAWTLIDMGSVTLPAMRLTVGPVVNVNSGGVGYEHYKMIFPTTKGSTIMQIADIQFFLDDAGTPANALLQPTDPIKAVDEVPTPAGWSGSSFPANEHPGLALDRVPTTKYLNFGEERSGLIITNAEGPVQVNYMKIRTANDAVERDPTSYQLYGTNDPIQSVQNSTGNLGEVWTLISSGPLSLPDTRFTDGPVVAINSPAAYRSYKLIFPTVKNAAAANSMQIADVQFSTTLSGIPEPATLALVGLGVTCVATWRRRQG